MKLIPIFVFSTAILTVALVKGEDCEGKSDPPAVRLKKHVMCGYDRTLRPVKNNTAHVKVLLRMVLKYFEYNQHDNSFSVDSWLAMFWKDEHLTWDPKDYDSIDTLHLSTDEIWLPDLSVYNRKGQSGSPAAVDWGTCIVSNTGQVVCVPPTRQTSLCVADLTKYPFDSQNCTVRFGSWVHSGEEIDFRLSKPTITLEDLVPNGEWALVSTNVVRHPGKYKCCPNNTYPSINFSFKIQRLSGAHAASVVLPVIALIVVTLTSLWIPPNQTDRMTLCCVNLLSQFLFSQYISWQLPLNGENIPNLILFSRDSLLLCAFTIILSVALKICMDKPTPAPAWVATVVALIMGCAPGRWMFGDGAPERNMTQLKPDEDEANILISTPPTKSQDWAIFARILDRLCFVAYTLVFLTMLITLTP